MLPISPRAILLCEFELSYETLLSWFETYTVFVVVTVLVEVLTGGYFAIRDLYKEGLIS